MLDSTESVHLGELYTVFTYARNYKKNKRVNMHMETQIIKLFHIGPSREKGWVYSQDGVMATMTSTCYKEPPKVLVDTDYSIKPKSKKRTDSI